MTKTNNSRGQAALEFLTTYGWALMVILIMISALGYFGIMNPSDLLPETCTMQTGFNCNDHLISEAGTAGVNDELRLQLSFTNNIGSAVTINGFQFRDISAGTITTNCATTIPFTLINGESTTLDCNAVSSSNSFTAPGGKQELGFSMNYTEAGSSFVHTATGEVFGRVE